MKSTVFRTVLSGAACGAVALGAIGCGATASDEPAVARTVPGKTPTTPTTIFRDCQPAAVTPPPEDQKPALTKGEGTPPTELVKEDLKVGDGVEAVAGDDVQMMYTGVLFNDGTEFDSSWKTGRSPFEVTNLGQGQVIDGWNQGIQGMKVGGRRKLVIPPGLAYGDQARDPIPANSTLIFVVDLLQVCKKAAAPTGSTPGSTPGASTTGATDPAGASTTAPGASTVTTAPPSTSTAAPTTAPGPSGTSGPSTVPGVGPSTTVPPAGTTISTTG